MGYGLGASSAAAFQVKAEKRPIAVMGDGGFWHNGLASGIANAVFNKHDGVRAAGGRLTTRRHRGQEFLLARRQCRRAAPAHPIEAAVRGVGARWVRRIDRTYSVAKKLRDLCATR